MKNEQVTIVATGAVIGLLAAMLVFFGNPANMGLCIACFCVILPAAWLACRQGCAVHPSGNQRFGAGRLGCSLYARRIFAEGRQLSADTFCTGLFCDDRLSDVFGLSVQNAAAYCRR